jgi:hypothetical protein
LLVDLAEFTCFYQFLHNVIINRGVSGYLKLGGQVVMWRAAAAAPPSGGAFYSAQNWVGNCPPCPPATYAPDKIDLQNNFMFRSLGWSRLCTSQTEKLMAGTKLSDYLGLKHYKKAKKINHFIHLNLANWPQSVSTCHSISLTV